MDKVGHVVDNATSLPRFVGQRCPRRRIRLPVGYVLRGFLLLSDCGGVDADFDEMGWCYVDVFRKGLLTLLEYVGAIRSGADAASKTDFVFLAGGMSNGLHSFSQI